MLIRFHKLVTSIRAKGQYPADKMWDESWGLFAFDTTVLQHPVNSFEGPVNFSDSGQFQWSLFDFTSHSSLSSSCCSLLIWEHQFSSFSKLTSENTIICFNLFHLVSLRNLWLGYYIVFKWWLPLHTMSLVFWCWFRATFGRFISYFAIILRIYHHLTFY